MREPEGAVCALYVLVVVRAREGWEHGLQVRGILPGNRVLAYAVIGVARGRHDSIGPWLLGDPLHRVVAVSGQVQVYVELALRGPMASFVLEDEDVASLSEVLGVVIGGSAWDLVVWGSVQDGWKSALGQSTVPGWEV